MMSDPRFLNANSYKRVFHYVNRPVNIGRRVVFKRFLRIYCPRNGRKRIVFCEKNVLLLKNTSKQRNTNCFSVC